MLVLIVSHVIGISVVCVYGVYNYYDHVVVVVVVVDCVLVRSLLSSTGMML